MCGACNFPLKTLGLLLIALFITSSCYYFEAARIQGEIWWKQIPLTKAINTAPSAEVERKLSLAYEVIQFAERELKLNPKGNYQNYCPLNRPQVSFLLSASKKWALEPKVWKYLIVGELPYRGYLQKEDVESEAQKLEAEEYDTYIRPVTAYSTLGWFKDPILSTMLADEDEFLVETLIHELIHTEIFIKNEADFNEALATYMGVWGAQLFFESRQQYDLAKKLKDRMREKILFSQFLNQVREDLKKWYALFPHEKKESLRQEKLHTIKESCQKQGLRYCHFLSNNARILAFGTYYSEIENIDNWVHTQNNLNFSATLTLLKEALNKKNLSPRDFFKITSKKPDN